MGSSGVAFVRNAMSGFFLRAAEQQAPARYFVGIGAQKAGTSWFYKYLRGHPQVFMASVKELHYFDSKYAPHLYSEADLIRPMVERLRAAAHRSNSVSWTPEHLKLAAQERAELECLSARVRMVDDESEYARYFQRQVRKRHRVYGEISPSYSMLSAEGFAAIRSMFPDARFILLMRNPADRCWSMFRMLHPDLRGLDVQAKFRELIRSDQCRYRTDYARTLEQLSRAVPAGDVLAIFFESLFGPEGATELRRITRFLGIGYKPADFEQAVNSGRAEDMPADLRTEVVALYRPVYEFARSAFGATPGSWLCDLG